MLDLCGGVRHLIASVTEEISKQRSTGLCCSGRQEQSSSTGKREFLADKPNRGATRPGAQARSA